MGKWGWSPRWDGERERVHWSELGHQGKVRREDEKERERENEGKKELFTAAVTALCCCLPGGKVGYFLFHFLLFFLPE